MIRIALLLFSAVMMSLPVSAENISSEKSNAIVDAIYGKMEPGYKKNSGFYSIRTTKFRLYDSKSDRLIDTIDSIVKIKNDFYGIQDAVKVIKYVKNGEELPASKYTERKSQQFYPVFDNDGKKRYSVSVAGEKKIAGIECWQLIVKPKENTPRHFSGSIYFSKKDMNIVALEGGQGAPETGVKSFYVYNLFRTIESIPVPVKSRIELVVHVPVFFPNKKMLMDIDYSDHELIPK